MSRSSVAVWASAVRLANHSCLSAHANHMITACRSTSFIRRSRDISIQIMRGLHVGVQASRPESTKSYEEAVRALNTLQSNAAYLEKTRAERDKKRHLSLPETLETLQRVGITSDVIDGLSVIHVSGTKGKGSTCAFVESILRAHGYKTGFFSSPHLIEVRERIRINGRSLSRDAFSTYFWECLNPLEDSKEAHAGNMPSYFRFLTVLAFHVFVKEKVDVAILEVGIGGEFDCTNVVRSPVVCGVTSLDTDHTSILGDTIQQIAWHKAGIFKPGVPAFTVSQPEDSIDVIKNRARERGCPLKELRGGIENYDLCGRQVELGIKGEKQELNAALGLQLCKVWMEDSRLDEQTLREKYLPYREGTVSDPWSMASGFPITELMAKGLRDCRWHGRCQTLTRDRMTYFIDGAHTPRSIEACVAWFREASRDAAKQSSGPVARVLLFNATGDRKPETLLIPLMNCDFDCALFTPNMIQPKSNSADQTNYMVTLETQMSKCRLNRNVWLDLMAGYSCASPSESASTSAPEIVPARDASPPNGATISSTDTPACETGGNSFRDHSGSAPTSGLCGSTDRRVTCMEQPDARMAHPALTFTSIAETLDWVSQGRDPSIPSLGGATGPEVPVPDFIRNASQVHVLCTGSLHLVGGVLKVLDPDLCNQ